MLPAPPHRVLLMHPSLLAPAGPARRRGLQLLRKLIMCTDVCDLIRTRGFGFIRDRDEEGAINGTFVVPYLIA